MSEYSHTCVGRNEFKILNKGFRNDPNNRNVSEGLLSKEYRPNYKLC